MIHCMFSCAPVPVCAPACRSGVGFNRMRLAVCVVVVVVAAAAVVVV